MSPALTSTMIRFLVLLSVIKGTAAATTAPTSTTTPLKCENGGVSNGVKCICPEFTEGTRCQSIKDRIKIGTDYNATLIMALTFDYTYTRELHEENSAAYKDFSNKYNAMMTTLLQGFQARYEIKSLGEKFQLTAVVNEISMTLQYHNTVPVLDQYQETYQEIASALKNNCILHSLCTFDSTDLVIPPSKEAKCNQIITPAFMKYFRPVVDKDGLVCVSRCDPGIGKEFLNCSPGNCQIKEQNGPQCFCPDTDQYLYTYSGCQGRVLIVAMYGGVGAAVGLLVIISVVLGVFLYKKKHYK